MDNENEMTELQKQMGELAARGAVLGARGLIEKVKENLDFEVDLRSFLVGTTAQGMADSPVPLEYAIPKAMEFLEPNIARLELDEAEDHFADLPVFDPGNGS